MVIRQPAPSGERQPQRPALLALSLLACVLFSGIAATSAAAVGLYVSNTSSNNVSAFGIDTDGELSPLACSPPANCAAGNYPQGVAIDPSASHLYTANTFDHTVSAFTINANGTLTALPCPVSCTTGTDPTAVAIDPAGEYVFVASDSGTISVFTIGADGALSPVTCSPAANCSSVGAGIGAAVDPAGAHLYVATGLNSVAVFSINPGGSLTPVACDPNTACKTGNGPFGVAIDPGGSHLYVANNAAKSISAFAIGADGALTPLPCSPAANCTPSGNNPHGLAIDPTGTHLYVTDFNSANVSVFAIGADGTLSPVPCLPAANCTTGSFPEGISIDPAGGHLYTSNNAPSTVSEFLIGAGGALTPLPCASPNCDTGTHPGAFSLAISPDRGPQASFSSVAGRAGSPSVFDGSGSSSLDYPIVSYSWDFGDGQSQTTAGPSVQHVYALPGNYTATLTVSDQAGCSQQLVFTGQSASCNGSQKALASHPVNVAALPATPAASTPSPAPTPIPTPGAAPTSSLGAVTISGLTARALITCQGSSGQSCIADVTLTSLEHLRGSRPTGVAARKGRRTSKRITDARAHYLLPAGQSQRVSLTLNATARKLLSRFKRLPATLSLDGKATTTVTFKATTRKRRKRRHH